MQFRAISALAQKLDAMHFYLDAASSMISVPSSPVGPSEMLAGLQSLMSGDGILLMWDAHGFAFFWEGMTACASRLAMVS